MSAFLGRGVTLYNKAIGGSLVATMAARYTAQVYPLRPSVTRKPAILVVFCGGNDIATDYSAADTITALGTYCTTAQGHGFEVWVCTDISRTNFTPAPLKYVV
jgi:hypothetical protein